MENLNLPMILNAFVTFEIVMSIAFYALGAFYNFRFLYLTKCQPYSWTKWFIAIVCCLYVLVFSHLVYQFVVNNRIDVSMFSALYIRPITMLMGAAIASSARARLTALKDGGEEWILRKSLI